MIYSTCKAVRSQGSCGSLINHVANSAILKCPVFITCVKTHYIIIIMVLLTELSK